MQHVAGERGLAGARDAVTIESFPTEAHVDVLEIVQAGADHFEPKAWTSPRRGAAAAVLQRLAKESSRERRGFAFSSSAVPARRSRAPGVPAGPRSITLLGAADCIPRDNQISSSVLRRLGAKATRWSWSSRRGQIRRAEHVIDLAPARDAWAARSSAQDRRGVRRIPRRSRDDSFASRLKHPLQRRRRRGEVHAFGRSDRRPPAQSQGHRRALPVGKVSIVTGVSGSGKVHARPATCCMKIFSALVAGQRNG